MQDASQDLSLLFGKLGTASFCGCKVAYSTILDETVRRLLYLFEFEVALSEEYLFY